MPRYAVRSRPHWPWEQAIPHRRRRPEAVVLPYERYLRLVGGRARVATPLGPSVALAYEIGLI